MAQAADTHITILSRRALLTRAAAAVPVVAIAAAGTVAAVKMPAHPDAELLAAWEGFQKWWYAIDAMPLETSDADMEPLYAQQDKFRDMIEDLPAKTNEGLAIKLTYLFLKFNESRHAEEIVFLGHPYDADVHVDYRDQMLWNMAVAAKSTGA